jgi:hypothetical protein
MKLARNPRFEPPKEGTGQGFIIGMPGGPAQATGRELMPTPRKIMLRSTDISMISRLS